MEIVMLLVITDQIWPKLQPRLIATTLNIFETALALLLCIKTKPSKEITNPDIMGGVDSILLAACCANYTSIV